MLSFCIPRIQISLIDRLVFMNCTKEIQLFNEIYVIVFLILDELHKLWDLLLSRLAEKGMKLQQALVLVQFLRQCDEVMFWIKDKVRKIVNWDILPLTLFEYTLNLQRYFI